MVASLSVGDRKDKNDDAKIAEDLKEHEFLRMNSGITVQNNL
jgi:hypothetical protein